MTSPNEPATQGAGCRRLAAMAARCRPGPSRGIAPAGRTAPPMSRPAAAPVGADARLNLFISGSTTPATGGSAPKAGTKEADAAPARGDTASRRCLRQRIARSVRARFHGRHSAPPRPSGVRSLSARLGAQPPGIPGKPRAGIPAYAERTGSGQHANPPDRSVEHVEGVPDTVRGIVLRLDGRGRVSLLGARWHGRVGQTEQQRRRPANNTSGSTGDSSPPALSSAAPF